MSDNKGFMELYEQTRENHNKLHNWDLYGLSVWFVEGLDKRQVAEIADCHDFAAITEKGCVLITNNHGIWVKINTQYWFNPVTDQDSLMHDLDVLKFLITESDEGKVAAIIGPGK